MRRARFIGYPAGIVALLLVLVGGRIQAGDAFTFPDYASLSKGVWQARLLPGQRQVVFTMYGAPAEIESLRQVVEVMREQKLGNGFDPGPTARAISKPVLDYLATVG
ncbi:MAG: hypothetical protein M1608_06775 [Candidatus Omnitrophica bacterium]|nr:hypothetical protein [Candidatus Omnitrophota bacterium]